MPSLRTGSRERFLWISAGGLLLAIYATLYSMRQVAEWLRERDLLRLVIAATFVVTVVAVLRWCLARSPGRRELAVLALFAGVYLAVLWPVRMPEERFHLLEYGLFAGLVYAALIERRRPGGPMRWAPRQATLAIALAGLAGWADEGIQHLLPNRHYDWVDVGLNLLAAVLAVTAVASLAEARNADRSLGRQEQRSASAGRDGDRARG